MTRTMYDLMMFARERKYMFSCFFFFFQAEDGIRDLTVTGVQTCALPISTMEKYRDNVRAALDALKKQHPDAEKHSNGYRQIEMQVKQGIREVEDSMLAEIGRASCRERV